MKKVHNILTNHMTMDDRQWFMRMLRERGDQPFKILRRSRKDHKQVKLMIARKKNKFFWPPDGIWVQHVNNFFWKRRKVVQPKPFAYYRALARLRV